MKHTTSRTKKRTTTLEAEPRRIYCDGAGMRPDGKGSGFAFYEQASDHRHVERVDGLTNNQAEYMAFRAVVSWLPNGTRADVFTDSNLLCSQFNGSYKVHDFTLQKLLAEIQKIIAAKDLRIDLAWIPRGSNLGAC